MASAREFFTAVNAYWMEEFHVDGFRYDHVNGFLDRKPVAKDGGIDWYSHENRPTFASLQELTRATYIESKKYTRFVPLPGDSSRIVQIAEDLYESAYQLSPVSDSAVNGNWEKRLATAAGNMAVHDCLDPSFGKELLLSDERFDLQGYTGWKTVGAEAIPATVVQFIESHDECRLFYRIQNAKDCQDAGYEYCNGLDGQPWWILQPYAIGLMTCVGIPMIWAGQEFAENTGLAAGGLVRVRALRPLHWDYFYNVDAVQGGATVLPLVTLYRKLGALRKQYPALRSARDYAKEEYSNTNEEMLVYRRWQDGQVMIVALNFSNEERYAPIPFGHPGYWSDVLDGAYNQPPFGINVNDPDVPVWTSIPSNFGRIFLLT